MDKHKNDQPTGTEPSAGKTKEIRQHVQGLMIFLGALSDGLETIAGVGAEATCFLAGKKLGMEKDVTRTESDVFAAIAAVQDEMNKLGIDWPFDHEYGERNSKPEQEIEEENSHEIKFPFMNCIVRCTLFRYGFPQGKSLCQTKHGLFCGLFENIYGSSADLDIIHPGENACLLNLKVHKKS
jgi:predicted hydrocarbon binding protein